MTARLTFHPTCPGGRIIARLGEHEVGAIYPPLQETTLTRPAWGWHLWLAALPLEGRATSEQAAKDALTAKVREWLMKARIE
jgi:hypothetical protein